MSSRLYDSRLTLAEVGLKVGTAPQAVRRALAEHGVPIREGRERRSRIGRHLTRVVSSGGDSREHECFALVGTRLA